MPSRRYFISCTALVSASVVFDAAVPHFMFADSSVPDAIRANFPELYAATLVAATQQLLFSTSNPSSRYWETWIQSLAEASAPLDSKDSRKQAVQRISDVLNAKRKALNLQSFRSVLSIFRSDQNDLSADAATFVQEASSKSFAPIDPIAALCLSFFGAASEDMLQYGFIGSSAPHQTFGRSVQDDRLNFLTLALVQRSVALQSASPGVTAVFTDPLVRNGLKVDYSRSTTDLLASIDADTQKLVSTIATADPQRIANDPAYKKTLTDAVNAHIDSQLDRGDKQMKAIHDTLNAEHDSQTKPETLQSADEDAKRVHDEIAGAITISTTLITVVFKDPTTAKAIATVAGDLNTLARLEEEFSLKKIGSLTFSATLLTTFISLGSLLGGGPSVDQQILKAVQRLSKQLEDFRKEINTRLDVLQTLQLESLRLMQQAVDQLRELRFDLRNDFDNLVASITAFESYEKTAERDSRQTAFQTAVDHGRVLVQARLAGGSVDSGEYNECVIDLKEHAESISREAEFSGVISDNMTVQQLHDELNKANQIQLAVGLVPQIAEKAQVQILESRLPNPVEWAKGVQAFLQMRAVFSDITNVAYDQFVLEFWNTGCTLRENMNRVSSSPALQSVGQRLSDAFAKIVQQIESNIESYCQAYGGPLLLGPFPTFALSDERRVAGIPDLKVLKGRWETAPATGPFGYNAIVDNDPLDRSEQVGLIKRTLLGHEEHAVIFGKEFYDHYELAFQKGRKAGYPVGSENHIRFDMWTCTGNFKDASGVQRLDIGPLKKVPDKNGKTLLNYLQSELAAFHSETIDDWSGHFEHAVSVMDLSDLQQFGNALRLFAALAVWRTGDDSQLAVSVLQQESLILSAPTLLSDYVKQLVTALSPEMLSYIDSLVPIEQHTAFRDAISRIDADAALHGVVPSYSWSSLPVSLELKKVVSSVLRQKIDTSVRSLSNLAALPTKGLTVIDETLAQIGGYIITTGIGQVATGQPQELRLGST